MINVFAEGIRNTSFIIETLYKIRIECTYMGIEGCGYNVTSWVHMWVGIGRCLSLRWVGRSTCKQFTCQASRVGIWVGWVYK